MGRGNEKERVKLPSAKIELSFPLLPTNIIFRPKSPRKVCNSTRGTLQKKVLRAH